MKSYQPTTMYLDTKYYSYVYGQFKLMIINDKTFSGAVKLVPIILLYLLCHRLSKFFVLARIPTNSLDVDVDVEYGKQGNIPIILSMLVENCLLMVILGHMESHCRSLLVPEFMVQIGYFVSH